MAAHADRDHFADEVRRLRNLVPLETSERQSR